MEELRPHIGGNTLGAEPIRKCQLGWPKPATQNMTQLPWPEGQDVKEGMGQAGPRKRGVAWVCPFRGGEKKQ